MALTNHWFSRDPEWMKSLAAALYVSRRGGRIGATQPLLTILEEHLEWMEYASGEAWQNRFNRASLTEDFLHSVEALGEGLRNHIGALLQTYEEAITALTESPNSALGRSPGMRDLPIWNNATSSVVELIEALQTDESIAVCWDDLVKAVQRPTLVGVQHRPISELLFEQVRKRRDAERVFRDVVSILTTGTDPQTLENSEELESIEQRLAFSRRYISAPSETLPTVVWLGYKGRLFPDWEAGRVFMVSALWAVPNAGPEGQKFPYKNELWSIVRDGYRFQVPVSADEKPRVELLVRVDLGETAEANVVERAKHIVKTIFNVSIYNGGGRHPKLVESAVLRAGQVFSSGMYSEIEHFAPQGDSYGAAITEEALETYGPPTAKALAQGDLPPFLAAAIEAQTKADYPFSRERMLVQPSLEDIKNVLLLQDRVVQLIAAYVSIPPEDLARDLGEKWPHLRWLSDLRRAVSVCLDSTEAPCTLRQELMREWFNQDGSYPWILFISDRAADLLSLCRVESERRWIEKLFASISDHSEYTALLEWYSAKRDTLSKRRRRVRNALAHGNPVGAVTIESVREYSAYLSNSALNAGLGSFIEEKEPCHVLSQQTAEVRALQKGQDAATYWRTRVFGEDARGNKSCD